MLATTSATKKPSYFRTMMSNTNFQIFYHAPVLVLISATAPGAWIIEDCALAAENLMLGAYALGLGSCWIGSAKAYFKTPEGRTALSLPDAYEPVAPIILGYPSATAAPVTRKPPEIHWV
jgi:nitroreductase